MYKITQIIEKI